MDNPRVRQTAWRAEVLRLADALQEATARADWERLDALERVLMPLLRMHYPVVPLDDIERMALTRLRHAHDAAAIAAAAASRMLGMRLQEMQANKDGWIAYAIYNDTKTGTSPE